MNALTASLNCPKCHCKMESVDRSGVSIDQCTQCRGIYLDRGELPRLIDAEATYLHPQQPLPLPALR